MSRSKNKLGKIVSPDKRLKAEDYIPEIAKKLNMSERLISYAQDFLLICRKREAYKDIHSEKAVAAAVLYGAYRSCGGTEPKLNQKKVCFASGISVKSLSYHYHKINEMPKGYWDQFSNIVSKGKIRTPESILKARDYLPDFLKRVNAPERVEHSSHHVLTCFENDPSSIRAFNQKSVAAAALYIGFFENGERVSQREAADVAGVSVESLRFHTKRYQSIHSKKFKEMQLKSPSYKKFNELLLKGQSD